MSGKRGGCGLPGLDASLLHSMYMGTCHDPESASRQSKEVVRGGDEKALRGGGAAGCGFAVVGIGGVRERGQEDSAVEAVQGVVRKRSAEEGEEGGADQGQGGGAQVRPLASPFQAHLIEVLPFSCFRSPYPKGGLMKMAVFSVLIMGGLLMGKDHVQGYHKQQNRGLRHMQLNHLVHAPQGFRHWCHKDYYLFGNMKWDGRKPYHQNLQCHGKKRLGKATSF